MLCLANWNGLFYKSVYPIQSLRLSLSEGKKGRVRKKLERDTAKGESWRDKPTDGKLCSKESPLL